MNKNTAALLVLLCLWAAMPGSLSAEAPGSAATRDGSPWKIINYWSQTCAPCRVEIPELNELSAELAASGVVVVGVNFDENPRQETVQIAARMGIEFPTLTIAETEAFGLTAPFVLPTTYILSPDNKVRAKLIGAQDRASLKAKLAELGFRKE